MNKDPSPSSREHMAMADSKQIQVFLNCCYLQLGSTSRRSLFSGAHFLRENRSALEVGEAQYEEHH